jgi:hypothetical protein
VKREWEVKYWVAKTFGWTPDVVDGMSSHDIDMLIGQFNKEQKEIKRQNRLAKRKK